MLGIKTYKKTPRTHNLPERMIADSSEHPLSNAKRGFLFKN